MHDKFDADLEASARRSALWTAFIALLTFAVYWPVLRGEFVWDDLVLVKKNPLLTGEHSFGSIWFQGDFALTTVAFWIQHLLWGENPVGYHAVNIALHAFNALLVWRVLARLKIRGAWLASIIYVVHPVCVASVAWVSELKNTLSLVFCLLSMLWYLRFDEQKTGVVLRGSTTSVPRLPSLSPPTCWYWLSLGAFLLALLSKTSTVMLPVVLLAAAWWRRGRVTKSDSLAIAPHFALAVTFGVMTIWFQSHQAIGGETVQTEDFLGRLAGAGWVVWFYLGKALLPVNLCMIYPRWKAESAVVSLLPLILLGASFALLCWWGRRGRGRGVLFALFCFTATLFPVLGFFDMYFMVFARVSDHLEYLPLICIVALVAAVLRSALPGKLFWPVASVVIVGLGVLTAQRARVFATDEALWMDTLAKNPASWNAHNNLGCILAEQNKLDEALRHFEASLRINPRNTKALVNLARARSGEGKFTEAEALFREALKIKPDDADAHALYGLMLENVGRRDEAESHLRVAIRLRPENETRLVLAGMYRAAGKPGEAIEQCRQILRVQPDQTEALSNLAWLLATAADARVRDGKEAVRCAQRACALTGYKDAQKVGVLAAAYAEAGQFDKATTTAQQAVELARAAGNRQFAAANEQLLRLYSSGQAYHEPPRKARTPR